MNNQDFSQVLLRWFDQHGRKNLPWQQQINPYRVWVSEIMLQQTQVNTVIPFYQRFIERFQNVNALANAEEDEVLHLWTGLGYYARARNLHRCAKIVQHELNGEFPDSVDGLTALPGIGRSTAGAILSIAHRQRAAILDGNVKRVLARYHSVPGWPGQTSVQKQLWEYAETYTPYERVADYTQAIMDLGATLCTRSKPRCSECPLQTNCQALKDGNPGDYPHSKPKKTLPQKQAYVLLASNHKNEILLEKRPPHGIWGGLWSLPQADNMHDLISTCQTLGYSPKDQQLTDTISHTFSHFRLTLQPVQVQVGSSSTVNEDQRWRWIDPRQPNAIGLAAPIKKLLESL